MYRVELSNTYAETYFYFSDFGEAMGFIGIAIESGRCKNEKMTAKISCVEMKGLEEVDYDAV